MNGNQPMSSGTKARVAQELRQVRRDRLERRRQADLKRQQEGK
jgi:hypothetical protein